MRTVTFLDTSVASTNLGDEIIMEAARRHLDKLFSDAFIYRVATHEWMGDKSRALLKQSQAAISCGTHLLSSRMWVKPPWKVSPIDAISDLEVTLLGAGWGQHQSSADWYTRWLLKHMLSSEFIHSVRDDYSLQQLKQAGITQVLNTACPTMWELTPEHCALIPVEKGEVVVTTVNTALQNAELDKQMLLILKQHYQEVFFWVQTEGDLLYAKELAGSLSLELRILNPCVAAYDNILLSWPRIDYVGNRLQAGIRAMQFQRRSIIVEVDSCVQEMGKDFGLPTVERDKPEKLSALVSADWATRLTLPFDRIEQWQQQFRLPAETG
ncbi:MAG: polysaccharide pyruvyl transferase family protein [Granulosicoccus sp.]